MNTSNKRKHLSQKAKELGAELREVRGYMLIRPGTSNDGLFYQTLESVEIKLNNSGEELWN